MLADHAPHFWQWLDRAAGRDPAKRDIILAALFMVLANRYDWLLFLEVTGPGGSGKSIMAEIATMLAGTDNTTSATIETLESSRERAAVIGYSLIILPDQEKWSGDGAGIKAITGGDAVSVDPKYRDAYSTHIPAVILAVNNNPMRFTDRSGCVSRRRVFCTSRRSSRQKNVTRSLRKKSAVSWPLSCASLCSSSASHSRPNRCFSRSRTLTRRCASSAMRTRWWISAATCLRRPSQTHSIWVTPVSDRFSPGVTFIMPIWPIWRPTATGIR